jgi:hypothetical protein
MCNVIFMHWAHLLRLSVPFATFILLMSCGGGGGSKGPSQKSSSLPGTAATLILNGKITYDFVPHHQDFVGLNYSATERRPVRGAVVELIDSSGQVRASTITGSDGTYSANLEQNIFVKVRVKAQLLNSSSPSWDFKVTDNTSNNALYVLDGELASSGTTDSVRNLNASSGWGGFDYTGTRSAAPFAILDNVYTGVMRLMEAGNTKNLRPLELRWSSNNSAADGDYARGEIGTSFYDGSAIYILGDANNDIDEYDPHVLLHEWGHYLESELFRTDSIGGDHADGRFLDMRVAMSEGFANAFSGMMINAANYSDASGVAQSSGFTFDIARKVRPNKGYFSEGSVGSILYNFYASSENKIANDFTPLFQVLNSASYYANDALTSIYLFYSEMKKQFPEYLPVLQTLMHEQTIWGENEYGENESNSGGLVFQLPIYKKIFINGNPLRTCSSNQYGEQNKLGNSQFVMVNIAYPALYKVEVIKSSDASVLSKPEFSLYLKGEKITYVSNTINDKVFDIINLATGNYILEIYDKNYLDGERIHIKNTSCFDVRVTAN